MPYNNNGGPWGGAGGGGGGDNKGGGRGPWDPGGDNRGNDNRGNDNRGDKDKGGNRGPGGVPDIDEIVRKGQEQLRVLMGGRGPRGPAGGGGGRPNGGPSAASILMIGGGLAILFWLFMSVYTVRPEEQAVELTLGDCRGDCIGNPGLNFAPWPIVTHEIVQVTRENTEDVGSGGARAGRDGLMLTGDENIVDISFQVVWNVRDPAEFLFNLSDPTATIQAVSESAMREVISRSQLAPILNRDRGVIAQEVRDIIQATLDDYNSGVHVIRLNFDRADPPNEVIDSFRDVQAARQERSTLQNQADAYANQTLAGARGQSAQTIQESEGYRAQVVNAATGEASRFTAVQEQYVKAPEVTRERLYLETMESVLGNVQMFLMDTPTNGTGSGVVPYLPLNELRQPRETQQ